MNARAETASLPPIAARGQSVVLEGLSMVFDGFTAVQPTDLAIEAGEFFSILGPSGCGKTTILRMISGFLIPSTGRVMIGASDMTDVHPSRRPTSLIFQNLALFPLMSVRENVAFGLEARGIARAERNRRADELLDLVALTDQGSKRPSQLSGGQRQRVAIARALAVEPAVMLLDEPLSALDLKLRQHMRAELKSIQRKTGVTFIYITHDQGEALTMSDRIAVMRAGRIEQVGTGDDIYSRPETPFVATFLGEQNVLRGRIQRIDAGIAQVETAVGLLAGRMQPGLTQGQQAMLMVRPERLTPGPRGEQANGISGTLVRRDLEGPFLTFHVMAGNQPLTVHRPNDANFTAMPGDAVQLSFGPEDAVVMAPGEVARD
jgi:spermidine/putrescine transport system ATP-binding protein